MNSKPLIILIALISLIISLYPLTKSGFIAGHDSGYHATRTQLFLNAFKDGQFPVRWTEGPSPGQSHPLFEFYPPGFYYLSSFLTIYGALIAITVLGWLGMFLFIKKLTTNNSPQPPLNLRGGKSYSIGGVIDNNSPALLAATLFIFSPYHFSQLYVRAAYPELLATALIPWAFLGVLSSPISLILPISLMIPSHQPTLIMIAIPLLIWGIMHWKKSHLLVPPLALGLSAWFIIPLIFEQQFIRAGMLSSNYFDFHQHFATIKQLIYSPWGFGISVLGPNDGMSFQLGIINWLVVAITVVFLSLRVSYPNRSNPVSKWIATSNTPRDDERNVLFFLILLLSSLFLCTDLSLPFWERFSLLGFVQYPWRFLSVATFSTAALAGYLPNIIIPAPSVIPAKAGIYKNKSWIPAFAGMTIILPILFNLKYIAPSTYLPKDYFNLSNQELLKNVPNGGVEVGYLPLWVSQFPPLSQSLASPLTAPFSIISGQTSLTLDKNLTTFQSASLKTDAPSVIQVQTHYFPGWIAKIDGQTTIPAYNNPDGFMEITVPKGDHKIEFKFTSTPVRKFADYLTLFSSLILVLSLFWSKYFGATAAAPKKSPRISKAKP